jgi:hypothetical protein
VLRPLTSDLSIMTERERWIVYPLLFLALGAALRDKLSEHTKTKRIECQELIVYGEDSAGQPGIPLVEIGSMERTSAQSPHVGKIAVNGLIAVDGLIQGRKVEAEVMQASNVNADHYFFQRIPFAPLMRGGPGMSAADQLRALQLQQQAASAEKAAQGEPPAAKERPEEQP